MPDGWRCLQWYAIPIRVLVSRKKNDPRARGLTLTIILSNDPDPSPPSNSVRSLQTTRPASSAGTSGASVTATYVSQYFFPSISDMFETAGQVKVVDGPRVCDSTGWSEEIYIGGRTFSNVVIKTFDCTQIFEGQGVHTSKRWMPSPWTVAVAYPSDLESV